MTPCVCAASTVYDLQGASQDLPAPVMSEDAYLHVSAVDRCSSQLSCIYTEGWCQQIYPLLKADTFYNIPTTTLLFFSSMLTDIGLSVMPLLGENCRQEGTYSRLN